MQEFLAAASDFSKASSWLALIFALGGLLVSLFYIIGSPRDLGVKLVGSVFVVGLCFAANSVAVYPLGILIVATLITELQFLEKIAALFWNRKEYWDYLIGQASEKEVEKKVRQDITDEKPSAIPRAEFVHQALAFERKALRSLLSPKTPLKLNKLDIELRLQGRGRSMVFDGLGYSDGATYLFEVKAGKNIRNLADFAYQLDGYAQAYADYLRNIGGATDVRKILIVREGATPRNSIRDTAILRFDPGKDEFTNFEEVMKEFPAWNWKRT